MPNSSPGRSRQSLRSRVVGAIAPDLAEAGFERREIRFLDGSRSGFYCRVRNGVGQCVSVLTPSGVAARLATTSIWFQLDAFSVTVRKLLGSRAESLGGWPADMLFGQDVAPATVTGEWNAETMTPGTIADMRLRLRTAVSEHFDPLSSDEQLLSRISPRMALFRAILHAALRQREPALRECARIRRQCLQADAIDPKLQRALAAAGHPDMFEGSSDWRLQVRLVNEIIRQFDPSHEPDPSMLMDEFYAAADAADAARPAILPFDEARIRTALGRDDPNLIMTVNGVDYTREELRALLDD